MIEFRRRTEHDFDQHGIIPRHAVTLHDVMTGADIGIKFLFLHGFHFQIDKRLDIEAECLGVNSRVISFDISVAFEFFEARRNLRLRKESRNGSFE